MSAGKVVPLRYPLLLGTLAVLFALRVAGRLVVALLEPGWLPPFERWSSGLIARCDCPELCRKLALQFLDP